MDNNDSRYNRYEDVEISQEVTPDTVWVEEKDVEAQGNSGATAWSVISVILSVLSFFSYFYMSSLLAPAGIVFGVLGVKKGSSIGWWGVALGVIAIIARMVTLPFRLMF